MPEPTMAYVGVSKCGCIRAATVDNPAHAKAVRKNVSEFLRYGDTIERLTIEQVRVQFCAARHPKKVCPHPGACPARAANHKEAHDVVISQA